MYLTDGGARDTPLWPQAGVGDGDEGKNEGAGGEFAGYNRCGLERGRAARADDVKSSPELRADAQRSDRLLQRD